MILQVVFDESRGTGTGYDTLYANVDLNGRYGGVQRVTARTRRYSRGMRCDFPAININVPYKNKPVRTTYPCGIAFSYQKRSSSARMPGLAVSSSLGPTAATETFAVSSTIKLRRGADEWEYSFQDSIKPSETLESAAVWRFLQRPAITIVTRPDGRKPGNLGIGLTMVAGEKQFECKRGRIPAEAHVEIKIGEGRVVHRASGTLDKFTFG